MMIFTFITPTNGQSYTARGIITFRALTPNNIAYVEFRRDLSIQVSGTNWLINIDATHSTNDVSVLYASGYDGENIYSVTIAKGTLKKPADDAAAQYTFDNTACVLRDGFLPSMPTLGATFAWFTFVPAAKQKVFVENKGRCIWDDRLLSQFKIMFPVELGTAADENSDIKTIVWQNDGILRLQNNDGELRQMPCPEPYNHGYTNAIFTVTYTNINGERIPLSANLTSYNPGNGHPKKGDPVTVRPSQSFDFKLTSVTPGCETTTFHPSLPPMTLVEDGRLAEEHPEFHPFKIATNGGSWSAVPLNTLMSNYAKFEDDLKKHPASLVIDTSDHTLRTRRQVVIGCMAGVSILVFVLATRRAKTAYSA